jgi:hypothetical protein
MVRYQADFNPPGNGIREEQLHQGTGLRNAVIPAIIAVRPAVSLISGAAVTLLTEQAAFTSIKTSAWRGHLPVPMTPTLFIGVNCAGACQLQFRVTGFDQFDNHIVETTPIITVPANANNQCFLHLSKVFRFVENVEYKSNGLTALAVSVTISGIIDPTGVEGAGAGIDIGFGVAGPIRLIGTWANWGLGTPMRMAPYSTALPASTQPNFPPTRLQHQWEVTGATATRLKNNGATAAILNSVVNSGYLPIFGDSSSGNTTLRIGQSGAAFSSGGYITDRAWAGTPHKIGFVSSDAWATGFSKAFTGSSTRASGVPTAADQVGEDDLEFIIALRSSLGTRRATNPESSYIRG